MAISDAQFDARLRTDAPWVLLLELKFGYEAGGAHAEGTIYFSSKPYSTDASDTPASKRYRALITRAPVLTRSIPINGGRSTLSVSEVAFDNSNGELDFLEKKVIDGYEAAWYLGAPKGTPGWSRSDFRRIATSVGDRVLSASDDETVVSFRDTRFLLDRAVMGAQVGGSGPEAQRYLPLLFGSHFNVEAFAYDTATLIYSWASNAAGGYVDDVRDNGVSLTDTPLFANNLSISVDAATDVFTKAGHGLTINDALYFEENVGPGSYAALAPFPGMVAGVYYWVTSVPTANTFTLSATKGGASVNVTGATYAGSTFPDEDRIRVQRWTFDSTTGRIQLASIPAGRVTLDVEASPAPGLAPFAFAKYLIETYGGDGVSVDAAAFTAADAALTAKVSIGYTSYKIFDRQNLKDVLDNLMAASFGWYGVDVDGVVTCGLVDVSGIAAATVTRTLAKSQMLSPLTVENLPVGYGRVNVELESNNTIQGDGLAASVTADDRRRFASPYLSLQRSTEPTGTTYALNKPLYHRTMIEQGPTRRVEMASFRYNSDVAYAFDGYADEIVADQAPQLQIIRTSRDIAGYEWDPGDIVEVTHQRHYLGDGENALLIATAFDLNRMTVSLTMLRQLTPDTTTASHP
jgi:hypothetical protein